MSQDNAKITANNSAGTTSPFSWSVTDDMGVMFPSPSRYLVIGR
jgi:hypothetical protein